MYISELGTSSALGKMSTYPRTKKAKTTTGSRLMPTKLLTKSDAQVSQQLQGDMEEADWMNVDVDPPREEEVVLNGDWRFNDVASPEADSQLAADIKSGKLGIVRKSWDLRPKVSSNQKVVETKYYAVRVPAWFQATEDDLAKANLIRNRMLSVMDGNIVAPHPWEQRLSGQEFIRLAYASVLRLLDRAEVLLFAYAVTDRKVRPRSGMYLSPSDERFAKTCARKALNFIFASCLGNKNIFDDIMQNAGLLDHVMQDTVVKNDQTGEQSIFPWIALYSMGYGFRPFKRYYQVAPKPSVGEGNTLISGPVYNGNLVDFQFMNMRRRKLLQTITSELSRDDFRYVPRWHRLIYKKRTIRSEGNAQINARLHGMNPNAVAAVFTHLGKARKAAGGALGTFKTKLLPHVQSLDDSPEYRAMEVQLGSCVTHLKALTSFINTVLGHTPPQNS